jgi:putative transposase
VVSDPGDYPGSSYRANAWGPPDAILSPHPIDLALATGEAQRREVYSDLFRTTLDEAPLVTLRAHRQDLLQDP